MIETEYRIENQIDGDVRTTTIAVVAERCSRNGARVTAVTGARR